MTRRGSLAERVTATAQDCHLTRFPACSSKILTSLALCAGLLAGPALAQTGVPPTVDPRDPRGRVEPPRPEPDIGTPSVPAYRGVVPPNADSTFFTFDRVVVEGASVLDTDTLNAPFRPLQGREISLAQLYEAANQLQAVYRGRGYLLTRVVVPAQRITDGTVRIRVVEGFISRVVLEGDIGPSAKLVKRYLEQLIGLRPVRTQDIERYLLLANDIPGVTASGVLKADQGEAGSAQLLVRLGRKPYDGYFTINNRGSQFTGPWSTAISASANSFTEHGERVQGLFYVTPDKQDPTELFGRGQGPEQSFLLAAFEARIGAEGTRIEAEVSQGVSHPGFSLAPLRIENRVDRYNVRVVHPLIRSRRLNLDLSAGFEKVFEKVNLGGAAPGSRDNLTLMRAGARLEHRDAAFRDKPGRTEVTVEIEQGLPILGATDKDDFNSTRFVDANGKSCNPNVDPVCFEVPDQQPSRPEGTAVYTAARARLERDQTLSRNWSVRVTAEGQYAFDTLLSQSEFRVGGDEFGRAFDPSELAGDHGLGASVEVQYNGLLPYEALPSFQAYGFYDYGLVINEDEGFKPKESLSSTGAGVRAPIKDNMYLELEYARTLNRSLGSKAIDEPSNLYFMRFTSQF